MLDPWRKPNECCTLVFCQQTDISTRPSSHWAMTEHQNKMIRDELRMLIPGSENQNGWNSKNVSHLKCYPYFITKYRNQHCPFQQSVAVLMFKYKGRHQFCWNYELKWMIIYKLVASQRVSNVWSIKMAAAALEIPKSC